jgi:hypothetical protein
VRTGSHARDARADTRAFGIEWNVYQNPGVRRSTGRTAGGAVVRWPGSPSSAPWPHCRPTNAARGVAETRQGCYSLARVAWGARGGLSDGMARMAREAQYPGELCTPGSQGRRA